MSKVTRFVIYFFSIYVFIMFGWWGSDMYKNSKNQNLQLPNWTKPKPLEKYTIENLSKTEFKSSKINIKDNIFDFKVEETLRQGSGQRKVTGLINIPEVTNTPIIILIRGYVDQSIYQTGMGTKKIGEYFANNGYITLAPDFLGYGGSDSESENIFESRFQTYTTTLTLLTSVSKENFPTWDGKNIFIWAHGNGGQIALTVLEVTGEKYPTVLWAPVTEAFPYSVLYYTNESEDGGKFIRNKLAKFEDDYDVDKFSFTNYLDRINAPIEYHWGTNDDAISSEWRDRFLKRMRKLEKDVTNYNHSGANHDMNPLWSEVMLQTLSFFNKKINN